MVNRTWISLTKTSVKYNISFQERVTSNTMNDQHMIVESILARQYLGICFLLKKNLGANNMINRHIANEL